MASWYDQRFKIILSVLPIQTIGSLFKFKDRLPSDMTSGVIYLFTCPNCSLGTGSYIGSTERMLRVRVAGHLDTSHRTGIDLGVKER